jgi:hypothetical protein
MKWCFTNIDAIADNVVPRDQRVAEVHADAPDPNQPIGVLRPAALVEKRGSGLRRQRAASPGLAGSKKRSPTKGAPTIVTPEAWLPAIAGSSIGAKGPARPPIRWSGPKRAPAAI